MKTSGIGWRGGDVYGLPRDVCMRITHRCNAACLFCFAPSDALQPDEETLLRRIRWLMARGAEAIHFCGGEPSLHPGLPRMLRESATEGATCRITTNGLAFSPELFDSIRLFRPRVKISLHGDKTHHNRATGVDGFDRTVETLEQLTRWGVDVSVQATLTAEAFRMADWLARFCVERGVRRLTFLPAAARGKALENGENMLWTPAGRRELREEVKRKRRQYSGRLDIRWLDFGAEAYFIIDADGRALVEGPGDAAPKKIFEIPA